VNVHDDDLEPFVDPDSGKVRVVTRGPSQGGERLATQFRLADDVEFLDGE
jgi:hypothetical protein